jgi:hypothetical protein
MSKKRRRRVVSDDESGDESEDSEDSEDSKNSFIASSSDEEDDDDDDDDDSNSDEEEDEEEEEEEEEVQEKGYLDKAEMRRRFKKNPELGERPEYVDAREHTTQLSAEETWTHIVNTIGMMASENKCGVRATEHGDFRVVERFDYGSEGDRSFWNRNHGMGSYEKILVPFVEELFCQQAYQPPPENKKEMPKYAFSGWTLVMDCDTQDELGDSVVGEDLWCICCQNYERNQLRNIQIMQHVKSGIYLLTGGNCAAYMLGMPSSKEAAALCPPCDPHDKQKRFRMIMYTGRKVV